MKAEDFTRPENRKRPERQRALPPDVITGAYPGIFYVADRHGMLTQWNQRLQAITNLSDRQLGALRLADLFIEDDRERVEALLRDAGEQQDAQSIEASMQGSDGALVTFLLSVANAPGTGQVCGFGIDITARRARESLLRLRERALHAASNGIVITRCMGRENPIDYVNPAFERITGYTAAEALGRDSRFMAAPGLDDDLRTQLREAIRERREATVVFRNLRKDGGLFWNELSVTPVQDERGMVTHYIGIINDVTVIKERTSCLEHRLNHDALTGLVNRNLLWDRMEQALQAARRNKTLVAVVLVDLNKFKQINDTYGHEAGDLVLTVVSRRMQNAVRDTDTVARLAGDEFVLVLADQPSLRYTMRMIERLRANLAQPVAFDQHEIAIGASLGVSIYPHDADAPLELVKAADLAMYDAKASGDTEAHFYPADHRASADARRRFESNLVAALDNDEFFLMFQPRMGARDGALRGAQALLRWRHPEQGVLTPALFLKQAESNGMAKRSVTGCWRWPSIA
ncbi:hypothetical protein ASF61_04820 [Duganella sp. Leaf126]|nr:GGDEF domain-containing protein [Duganella sp. Leaf126]KQQ40118.1 hypothetical protein ASF61_04820 [Duganella sp. Leaf126]